MKFLITCIGILAFFIVFTETSNAQVGFAVAKDENGSALHWQWVKGETKSQAAREAERMLQNKGYKKIIQQACDDCDLDSGYWVVVYSTWKIYDGSNKTGYGFGISTSSYTDAEQRAVKHLSRYNWSWSESKHGYKIDKSGRL